MRDAERMLETAIASLDGQVIEGEVAAILGVASRSRVLALSRRFSTRMLPEHSLRARVASRRRQPRIPGREFSNCCAISRSRNCPMLTARKARWPICPIRKPRN